ncbi:MAG: hypothetical protein EOP85_21860 [Verrucomicrobiaceae bacterium]|nr:MAG: hypothetical protein EOP85_21860 [Verrucomicrobiaceae bacterium]
MDLISEVRGAFASDVVWLTDLEPLAAYDPFAEPATSGGGRNAKVVKSGKSLVKNDFVNVPYGVTSLAEVKADAPAAPVRRGAAAPPPASVATANAVRIKGFWRTKASQNVVSDLLKNLREKSTTFSFKVKDAKGEERVISDDRILDITVAGQGGDLALPFEITLPLVREVVIK